MSATPPNPTGITPTPNGGPNPIRRRRPPPTNPLVASRKPPRKPAGNKKPSNLKEPLPPTTTPRPTGTSAADAQPAGAPQIYPLVTTKRALLEGLRHHVMRFNVNDQKREVDPTKEEQFVKPVRLHRRDPRAGPTGPGGMGDVEMKDDVEDDKERERQEMLKAERRRIREENQAQIAPVSKAAKPAAFQKKIEQVYRADDTPEARKRSQLRYEEALPWHLEDFDNKSTWVGSYEAALSECHLMLVPEHDPNNAGGHGRFRMVPIEKWYKFKEKNKFKHLTIEEAEERMGKKFKDPRWFMETQKASEAKKKEEEMSKKVSGLFTRSGAGEAKPRKESDDFVNVPENAPDADDIDFNVNEEFADDEENALFEGDEEATKDTEERIKREQLGANAFDLRDEKAVEAQAAEEKRLRLLQKAHGKRTRKALRKREKNFDFEDVQENSDASSEYTSDDSDSDLDRTAEEESKKQEEAKQPVKGEKPASGASTKGTTTPSGRPKHNDSLNAKKSLPIQQPQLQQNAGPSLKRPGSPYLSDASGNESSRKKHKKKHDSTSRPMSPAGGLSPGGPAPLSRKPSLLAGAGSDSEGTDGGKVQRLKLKLNSPNGTPHGSRAGSPAVAGAARAASPNAASNAPRKGPSGMPTVEDIRAHVPPEGIGIQQLLAAFKSRIGNGKEDQREFVSLVKKTTHFNQKDRRFYTKTS